MKEEISHIGIEVPENLPDFASENIITELQTVGLNIKVHKKPNPGPMGAFEWIIPTAIAAYISKSYFDGFLKEAGKDHYIILKSWLKKFIDNGRLIKVQTIYASQSSIKKPNNNTQSKSVSLFIQTKSGKTIKLLFDNDLTKEDWDNAIDKLLDFVIANYEKYPNDNLTKDLERFKSDKHHIIYAIIDKENKELKLYDDKDLFNLQRLNQNTNTDENI